MKILLVEDHSESRQTLAGLIERRGHEVVSVASAEEAEKALASYGFPFLILDWMLPRKSGLDLCRELRGRPRGDEIFILLITARTETEDLERALAAGANDYLSKPLDPALLNIRLSVAEHRIRGLIERNQARAELQESARRLTEILEKTTDGFFAVDGAWRFTYLNAQAEKLFGQRRDTLLGRELWAEFPYFAGSAFEQNYCRVLSEQVPIEFEVIDSTGKNFEMRAYPSGGGVSAFFRDVTDRKRTEEERLTTSKLESLGTLAGGIAHDLNNILTVISGNIGLAQLEAPAGATSLPVHLSRAAHAAQHAARLSGQLLTFAKGGAPVKRVVSIGPLVSQAAEFSLYGSNLRAEIDMPVDLWKTEVDPGQIEQVVNALMINAREAMPHGGTVRVAVRNTDIGEKSTLPLNRGRYLKITITDAGGGIADEVAANIFDPYFTTKPHGSGLGLAISYSIVKKHGGILHLEHSSRDGSTFAFYLPATNQTVPTMEFCPPERPPMLTSPRVLVMDDEAAVRELISDVLVTLGFEVTAVPDGSEAVNTYERALRQGESFQAVILDATIRGGMGGLATIERLRKVDPNVTAIICSGYSDQAALSKFLSYGFRAALPKPFTRHELADVLRRACATTQPPTR
jgi:two-component system cell cycle sensor histidine kinase/response regulator CckA